MFHSRSTIVFISLTPQHDGFGQHERSCPLQKFRKLCSPCPSPPSIPSARVGGLPSSPVTSRHIPSPPPRHAMPLMRSRHNSSRDAAIEAGEYARAPFAYPLHRHYSSKSPQQCWKGKLGNSSLLLLLSQELVQRRKGRGEGRATLLFVVLYL